MKDILCAIEIADDEQIAHIIAAIIKRYSVVNPDWEVFFLSLPKNDSEERKHYIQTITAMLLHEKETNAP